MIRAALVLLALLLSAGAATAYPHFQFASGTDRCVDCHVTPSGGGLLTEWGHDELGDTLAMSGDGRALHGAPLPSWLALGADLRMAALVEDAGAEGARVAVFPMQVEAAARVARGGVAAAVVVGLRAAARPAGARTGDAAGGFAGLAAISREHVLGYQPDDLRWYVRAGRQMPAFGLRLADHTAFVRQRLGFGLYEEPYALSAGWLDARTEVHAAAFVSDPWQWPRAREVGATALVERLGGGRAVIASARVSASALVQRAIVGVAGKWWREGSHLLLMGELDGGWVRFPEADAGRGFAAAWLGPTWSPGHGLAVTAALEAWLPDTGALDSHRVALAPSVQWLPWAHLEVALAVRLQQIGADQTAAMTMLQLHYLP